MAKRVRPPPVFISRKPFDEETYIELWQVRGRYFLRFRDRRTGRFVRRKPIYRLSKCIRDIPVHRVYHCVIAQAFGSRQVLEDNERRIEEDLVAFTEGVLGYRETQWWFAYSIEESLQEFPVPPGLERQIFEAINTVVFRYEDEEGTTIEEEEEELHVD